MKRKHFIKTAAAAGALMTLSSLRNFTDTLSEEDEKMPVLFVGHGSPMNAIEDNEFTQQWAKMGSEIIKPKAVICVSAHWLTRGTHVTAMAQPPTIHDFGGFPKALFDTQYPAPGDPALATETRTLIQKTTVGLDHEWGLDHGTWSILKKMYPLADIPVIQLSIDYNQPGSYHFELGRELAALRKKGVLIIGSGNMVHNLGMVAWDKMNEPGFGFDWCIEMNEYFKKHITEGDVTPLLDYQKLGKAAQLAIPTPDHYYPLLYTLGLRDENDAVSIFNDKAMAGSLTMTSVKIG
jgi:4,5-DOPA dioxygenase extradiol